MEGTVSLPGKGVLDQGLKLQGATVEPRPQPVWIHGLCSRARPAC